MTKKEKFFEILNKYRVSKCHVSKGFDFEADEPNGDIFVDIKSNDLDMAIYKLYTLDKDGLVSDEQSLWVSYDNFSKILPNYIKGVDF